MVSTAPEVNSRLLNVICEVLLIKPLCTHIAGSSPTASSFLVSLLFISDAGCLWRSYSPCCSSLCSFALATTSSWETYPLLFPRNSGHSHCPQPTNHPPDRYLLLLTDTSLLPESLPWRPQQNKDHFLYFHTNFCMCLLMNLQFCFVVICFYLDWASWSRDLHCLYSIA